MLDIRLPSVMFTGKDDLYAIIRENRKYINALELRIDALELNAKKVTFEEPMANTTGCSGMRPNRIGRPKGSKNK